MKVKSQTDNGYNKGEKSILIMKNVCMEIVFGFVNIITILKGNNNKKLYLVSNVVQIICGYFNTYHWISIRC